MTALALPYVEIQGSGLIQPFGVIALLGLAAGVLTTVLVGRKRGIPGSELGLITPLAAIAVVLGAHFFDVAWYQWDMASQDTMLWLKIQQGVSVFGGVGGAALAIWPLAMGKPTLRAWADVAALGMLVGLTIGRIGCALVHDHLGNPTDLPIGIDVPVDRLWFPEARDLVVEGATTVRLHDVGMEEFLLLLPLTIAALVLRNKFQRGMLAAAIALGYAAIRLPLETLRLRAFEPMQLGLTGGQWGCLVLVLVTSVFIALIKRRPTP